MAVAYSAPNRHGCLKVVENNYCASRRGMFSSLSMVFSLVCFFYAFNYGISFLLKFLFSLDNLQAVFAVYPS